MYLTVGVAILLLVMLKEETNGIEIDAVAAGLRLGQGSGGPNRAIPRFSQ